MHRWAAELVTSALSWICRDSQYCWLERIYFWLEPLDKQCLIRQNLHDRRGKKDQHRPEPVGYDLFVKANQLLKTVIGHLDEL